MQVVIIFVNLTKNIANFQVRCVVIDKVLIRAVYRDAAVGTFVSHVSRGQTACFQRFGIVGCGRSPGRLVVWMRAVGILPHELSAATDLRAGGAGKRVEKVVGLQENSLLLFLQRRGAFGGVMFGCTRFGNVGVWSRLSRMSLLGFGGWNMMG